MISVLALEVEDVATVNVLEDDEIRQRIKNFQVVNISTLRNNNV